MCTRFSSDNLFGNKYYWDPDKLPNLPGWPQQTTYPGFSSPALADLDNNGDLEIVIGSGEPYSTRAGDPVPGQGEVYVWHHTGALATGWPVKPLNAQNFDAQVLSSPVIADIDNDGQLEIIFSYIWDIQVYNFDGTQKNLLKTTWTVVGSPLVGDADNDGKVEIWIGASRSNEPWQNQNDNDLQGYLWRFESDQDGLGAMPWPMFHRDLAHSGLVPRPSRLSSDTANINLRQDINHLPLLRLRPCSLHCITRRPVRPLVCYRQTGPGHPITQQWHHQGGQSTVVKLTIDLAGLPNGINNLGSIQFSIADNPQNRAVDFGLLSIPVSAQLAAFHYISLPLTSGDNPANPI